MNGSMIMPLPVRLKDPEKIKRVRGGVEKAPLILRCNYESLLKKNCEDEIYNDWMHRRVVVCRDKRQRRNH